MLSTTVLLLILQAAVAGGAGMNVPPQLPDGPSSAPHRASVSPPDPATVRRAEFGDPAAQTRLGLWYARAAAGARNSSAAVGWLLRAATGGSVVAQSQLGFMYMSGDGVPRDAGAAVRWLEAAAKHGDATAQTNLALQYARGD